MRDALLKIWPDGVRTLLDLGCRDCWHTIGLPGVIVHHGVDIWPGAIALGRAKHGSRPELTLQVGEALEFTSKLGDKSYDAVVAIDLIEHLPQGDALGLIEEVERVGTFCAVWTTLGFIEQAGVDVDGNVNPHEEHVWGPTTAFFDRPGWRARTYPEWHGDRGGAILAWR